MPRLTPLSDIWQYHADAEAALRTYFSPANPQFNVRFAGYKSVELDAERETALSETEMRSSLITLARVEAALRRDYAARCKQNTFDEISVKFRKIHKVRKRSPHLEDDIIEIWYQHVDSSSRETISRLRGMLKFRHWLAHGRHWVIGNRYRFQDVYLIADTVVSGLPLQAA